MYITLTTRGILIILAGVIALASIPLTTNAQYRRSFDREAWEEWRERMEDSEEGVEALSDEEISRTESRRTSSSTRRKISNLDDDPVTNLPIPILFGVELRNLFPNFGDPRDGGARKHEGLDLMATKGTPIVSPTEAVVLRTGTGESAGKYVYTANPGGETFIYMHLDEIADIDEGDELEVGELIGYVGNTGNASGGPAHLHFEIRKNRTPNDPFPRISKIITLKDKIEYLDEILKDHDDEEELAQFLVQQYRGDFLAARAISIELPEAIEEELGVTPVPVTTGGLDLTLGSQGPQVVTLQLFLIGKGFSIPAGATGYFGAQTQAALIAFQRANGITPAAGYYGPITRARIAAM
jgi:hypothetical protein